MTAPLNTYGDTARPTTGTHGSEIASQRMDALDHAALVEALALYPNKAVCVDLGCGAGVQGLRFASLGHECHLYDLQAEPPLVRAARADAALDLHFHHGDLADAAMRRLPERIDLAFSQRFIHYLRHAEALNLMQALAARMRNGALLFLSASGLDSELGDDYPGRGQPLAQRFAPLAEPMRGKHGIHEPVCLYAQDDLQALAASAGLACRSIEPSPFGNIKGVFQQQG